MVLQLRNGQSLFEINVPEGSRLERTSSGSSALIIPGPDPKDTWQWLPAPAIVPAARQRHFGLSLISERQVTLPVQPYPARRQAG